jgi:hypothetical protein
LLREIALSPQAKPWVKNHERLDTLPSTLEAALSDLSIFEYFYRDASNYKAWGSVMLDGSCSPVDLERLRQGFDAGEFFIAEQLGLPPLYAELWELSGGPTSADHVWHSFYALSPARTDEIDKQTFAQVQKFIARVEAVNQWNETLSPHWEI